MQDNKRNIFFMKKLLAAFLLSMTIIPMKAQTILSLDSCRALALRNNKQLRISKLKKDVAVNTRKAVRTKYLPKVDAIGGYQYFSREISLLSNTQKGELSNLGTSLSSAGSQSMQGIGNNISNGFNDLLTGLVQQGALSQEMAQTIGTQVGNSLSSMGSSIGTTMGQQVTQAGNAIGQKIVDAFDTDTRNIWTGAVTLRQPIYMGGAIIAANKIADISEVMANNDLAMQQQGTLYDIDRAYWMVVSLNQKKKLAESYYKLVSKLNDDVHKMIKQGVTTKAEGLRVDVKVNEADMQITQVEDGLTLSKMMLCQLCGLNMNQPISLEDEDKENLDTRLEDNIFQPDSDITSRPEVRMLKNTIDISEQTIRLVRAQYLPHVALTGGYIVSNPNVFNGFQNKFGGVWNVGVTVQVPVWNWLEGEYKVRATKSAVIIAQMELSDTQEKIDLQISQSKFKLNESIKKLQMAEKNINSAEENLRCANLGFKEGVMEATDVMSAQTAWQQAQSQKIDAEIDVKLSQVGLNKALGILN